MDDDSSFQRIDMRDERENATIRLLRASQEITQSAPAQQEIGCLDVSARSVVLLFV